MKIRNTKRWAPAGARPYAMAAVALAAAFIVRLAFHPVLEDYLPFLTFTIAALLVEFYCGLLPALLTMTCGFLIGTYFFVPPYGVFLMPEPWDLVYTVGYFAVVLLGVVLIESLQRSRYEARLLREVAQSRLGMLERSHAGRLFAEEAARRSEKQYRALASGMPRIGYMRRLDGNFEYVNDEFYELTGRAPGSLEGSDWLKVIHPDDAPGVQSSWRQIAAAGAQRESGFRLRMTDGSYRHFTGTLSCSEDKRGKIIKWTGSASDAGADDLTSGSHAKIKPA
ncbi:MAG: PAS domain-containing protein [Burkholderiales bacterium]